MEEKTDSRMVKTGSGLIINKTNLKDEDEQQGITKCAKCGKVYLSAHGSCPDCK